MTRLPSSSMLDVIRRNYERFGFLPVETPVFELSEVLLTKTGGETERQVYFVQSTGALEQGSASASWPCASTSPCRWRATWPSTSTTWQLPVPPLPDAARLPRRARAARPLPRVLPVRHRRDRQGRAERALTTPRCPAVIHAVFSESLAIGEFTIQLNNRKLLRGFFEGVGIGRGRAQALVLREIDKLDKRGADCMCAKRSSAKASRVAPEWSQRMLAFSWQSRSDLGHADALGRSWMKLGEGQRQRSCFERRAATSCAKCWSWSRRYGVPDKNYAINFSIARGLDYYTGTVYETTLDAYPQIGSICSGGRYENLASHYTKSQAARRGDFDRPDAVVLAVARSRG